MILDELEAELCKISNGMELSACLGDEAGRGFPFVFGMPLKVYFGELANRLRSARKELKAVGCEPPPDNRPRIGDRCVVSERWEAVITALTIRASGQTEYQLEWVGDGELRSDWLTAGRMKLLGFRLFRDGREVRL